jgi:hypothetical protein
MHRPAPVVVNRDKSYIPNPGPRSVGSQESGDSIDVLAIVHCVSIDPIAFAIVRVYQRFIVEPFPLVECPTSERLEVTFNG